MERSPPGRPRATTWQQDRHLRMGAPRDITSTAVTLRDQLRVERGANISCSNLRRRLREGGLRSRRGAINRTRRPTWARQHLTWKCQQWRRFMFSDDSKSTLSVNFIENLKNVLWRRVRSSYPRPATMARLDQIHHAEWAAIPQAPFRNLVWGMSRRCEA